MKLSSSCVLMLAGVPTTYAFVAPGGFKGAALGARNHAQERSAIAVRGSSQGCHMMAGGRVPFIAGNWKMNPLDLTSAKDLAKQVICVRRGGVFASEVRASDRNRCVIADINTYAD